MGETVAAQARALREELLRGETTAEEQAAADAEFECATYVE